MSTYEHRPVNSNKGGVTRSGNTGGHYPTDRHPSDPAFDAPWWVWCAPAAAAVIGLLASGVVG